MTVYRYSEARQKLASLLDEAAREGEVRIQRKDDSIFVIRLEARAESPLDVPSLDLGSTRDEIVSFVREGRRTD